MWKESNWEIAIIVIVIKDKQDYGEYKWCLNICKEDFKIVKDVIYNVIIV